MNDRPRAIGSELTAPATHLALPMYRQTLEGDNLFRPLPNGMQLAGEPRDYLRLCVQNDDTVAFIPALFGRSPLGIIQIEELAYRILFALGTQNDNNWAAISYQAFCTAIVQEAVTRAEDQERQNAINQRRAKDEKTASNAIGMLERVLSGLRGNPTNSVATVPLPQPEYRHQISPLITCASDLAAAIDRYLQEMRNLGLIGSTEPSCFYPTERLTLELSSFYRPLFQES